MAQPAEGGHHFVGNVLDIVLAADFVGAHVIARRGHDDATRTLTLVSGIYEQVTHVVAFHREPLAGDEAE